MLSKRALRTRRTIRAFAARIRGFTLIELVVVLGLGAMLIGVLGAVVMQLLIHVPHGRASLTGTELTRQIVDVISSDAYSAASVQIGAGGSSLQITQHPSTSTTVVVTYQLSSSTLERMVTSGATTTTMFVADNVTSISFQSATTSASTTRVFGTVSVRPEGDSNAQFTTSWTTLTRIPPPTATPPPTTTPLPTLTPTPTPVPTP